MMSSLLPFRDQLPPRSRVLLCGMGGGFDVYCALPLMFALQAAGHDTQLASVSFADLQAYTDVDRTTPTMINAGPAPDGLTGYHPERYLARWLPQSNHPDHNVWCFEPTGSATIAADLRAIHRAFPYNVLIMVDGGIDSLTRGDEELVGTVLEDYASLIAADSLSDAPLRILACIGMGIESDVSVSQAFENTAGITADGGFLGCSALTRDSEEFTSYEKALTYARNQPGQQPSVINASIVSAVHGRFGDFHLTDRTRGSVLAISPLMSL